VGGVHKLRALTPTPVLHQVQFSRSIPQLVPSLRLHILRGPCVFKLKQVLCMIFHHYLQDYHYFLVRNFQHLLVCASASAAGGSDIHSADLNKLSLVLGQSPSSSSLVMSLNSQVACMFLSAAEPLFPPLELKQDRCMIRFHTVRSKNRNCHPCHQLFFLPSVSLIC
jgi:hypothetical protein